MIKIEHVVLPSAEQMEFVIEGMRNPHNSWDRSDSKKCDNCDECGKCAFPHLKEFDVGYNDFDLMQRLARAGTDHRKHLRMMPVMARITAPLYWWKEYDTYKVGTVSNSCSTMHKIQAKEFVLDDFSTEHLNLNSLVALRDLIKTLNYSRDCYIKDKDKGRWWQMIQLLPTSYNQTRNVMMNYEVLANMYKSRKGHKLDEWRTFCEWIETLPYSELITGGEDA